jgi:hypothetical protein
MSSSIGEGIHALAWASSCGIGMYLFGDLPRNEVARINRQALFLIGGLGVLQFYAPELRRSVACGVLCGLGMSIALEDYVLPRWRPFGSFQGPRPQQ